MTIGFADRVLEFSTTVGDGPMLLEGSRTGFQTFLDAFGDSGTCFYVIENPGFDEWEVGVGVVTDSPPTLTRTTVYDGSNGTTQVDFSAGVKQLRCTLPAAALPVAFLASFPVPDETTILKNTVDETKLLRISLADLTTGVTRVLTMGDRNVDLGSSGTFAERLHAASHQHGGSNEVATATAAANAIPKAGPGGTLASAWIPDLSSVYQVVNSVITALIGLAANRFIARASTGDAEPKVITDFAFAFLDDANAATAATTLGLGASSLVSHGRLTLTDGSPLITTNTSDGSDNRTVIIVGGGAVSANRGGRIECSGNEATNAGKVRLIPGVADGVTAGTVDLCNTAGAAVLAVAATRVTLSSVLAADNVSAPGTFAVAQQWAASGRYKQANTAGNITSPAGVLYHSASSVANAASSTETDFINQSIPANTLSVNGDRLRITGMISLSATADTQRVRTYWNGVAILDVTENLPSEGGYLTFDALIIRTGATEQRINVQYLISGDPGKPIHSMMTTGSATLSGAVTFRLTGTSATASNLSLLNHMIEYLPAP